MTTLSQNRKASHDYDILETYEAGIVLRGTEVKSCRQKDVAFMDSYAEVRDGELWLVGAHIATYSYGNRQNHEPRRTRKLLMHKSEVLRLRKAVETKGLTLVPLRVFLQKGKIKVAIGLCKGKRLFDKRETIKTKEQARELRRAVLRKE